MKYKFICENGHQVTKEIPMGSITMENMYCEECGTLLKQNISVGFKIPASMTAADSQQISWVNNQLKNRPSGKRRVLY